jgi:hypothetical protein
MTKRERAAVMLALRRKVLNEIRFDSLRDQLAEDHSEHDVERILEDFGEWVQAEINNLDARLQRLRT